jgi:hypothetical protein
MASSKDYLRKGDEATLAGTDAANPFVRQMYAKIAHHWHELAERVERQRAAPDDPAEPRVDIASVI